MQEDARRLDIAYFLCMLPDSNTDALPGRTGFNTILQRDAIPSTRCIGYLPVINASPTDPNTVYTILQRSISIANKLGFEKIVVVMGQAIYAKAQEIR